eukprot:SAG22_NODE_791_length_7210_cov_40.904936_8_plen_240_part_00
MLPLLNRFAVSYCLVLHVLPLALSRARSVVPCRAGQARAEQRAELIRKGFDARASAESGQAAAAAATEAAETVHRLRREAEAARQEREAAHRLERSTLQIEVAAVTARLEAAEAAHTGLQAVLDGFSAFAAARWQVDPAATAGECLRRWRELARAAARQRAVVWRLVARVRGAAQAAAFGVWRQKVAKAAATEMPSKKQNVRSYLVAYRKGRRQKSSVSNILWSCAILSNINFQKTLYC